MKIFLAKEGIPSTLPDEQMVGGPEEWWAVGLAGGASGDVLLDYRELGILRSLPSQSLIGFLKAPSTL